MTDTERKLLLAVATVLLVGASSHAQDVQPKSHPGPTNMTKEAEEALMAGHPLPLPNMPNLDRPVFVKDGALVCGGDINNFVLARETPPLQSIDLYRCNHVHGDTQVSIVLPRNNYGYAEDYGWGAVQIAWQGQASVANVYRAWVSISDLKNADEPAPRPVVVQPTVRTDPTPVATPVATPVPTPVATPVPAPVPTPVRKLRPSVHPRGSGSWDSGRCRRGAGHPPLHG